MSLMGEAGGQPAERAAGQPRLDFGIVSENLGPRLRGEIARTHDLGPKRT